MEPVTLVVAALAAGIAAGVGDTAKKSVLDAYAVLRSLLVKKFRGNAKAQETLADHQSDPDVYEQPLAKQLRETGVADDAEVLGAARQLLSLADPDGTRAGKYQIDMRGAQGVQVGDHGSMKVTIRGETRPITD